MATLASAVATVVPRAGLRATQGSRLLVPGYGASASRLGKRVLSSSSGPGAPPPPQPKQAPWTAPTWESSAPNNTQQEQPDTQKDSAGGSDEINQEATQHDCKRCRALTCQALGCEQKRLELEHMSRMCDFQLQREETKTDLYEVAMGLGAVLMVVCVFALMSVR